MGEPFDNAAVRCAAPCGRCAYAASCRPHVERIIAEHSQHGVDVIRAGEDPRFIPKIVLECGAGQFTPQQTKN